MLWDEKLIMHIPGYIWPGKIVYLTLRELSLLYGLLVQYKLFHALSPIIWQIV